MSPEMSPKTSPEELPPATPVGGRAALSGAQQAAVAMLASALLALCVVGLVRNGIPAPMATDPGGGSPALVVNVNTADWPVLSLVPGLGRAISRRIVAYRQAHGPFRSIDDLVAVDGIAAIRLGQIRPFVTVGDSPQVPTPDAGEE
jgi:competence protein ComEA